MGLRCLVALLVAEALLCSAATGSRMRHRRQAPEQVDPLETIPYKLPLLLSAPSAPVASSANIQNSYQPPISLIRSNEYQAAPAHTSYSVHQQPQQPQRQQQQYYPQAPPSYSVHQQQSSGPQQYQQSSSPQQYQHQSSGLHQQYQQQSSNPQQYQQASSGPQQSYSIYQQPSVPQPTSLATSYSVHQQPAAATNARQPFAVFDGSSSGGHPQSTAERTYSTHTKVVGSHVPAQAIHKAPASEIQSEDKASLAKERDAMKDEYVVYYYYYYDNDTAPSNNLSLNFDDIPSLESYDNDGLAKEPQKSASARALAANANALAPASEPKRDSVPASESSSSQPRSASGADREAFARGGDRFNHANTDTIVQPLKPVSNVFRYGSNEVPRFPVLPNFVVSEAPTARPTTPDPLSSESLTTQASVSSHVPSVNRHEDHESDDFNTVLDHSTDLKSEDKAANDDSQAVTTTTTEEPTTTEIPTTSTTERSRRRPPVGGGGRRRFNSSPSFAPNRSRQSPTRGTTSSSSSTTTTTSATPTRGSFRGSNRLRPRPNLNGNRPNRLQTDDTNKDSTPSPASTTARTTSTTSSSRSRFTTSAAPRRFQSSRSRSGTSSTTSTTSTTARTPPASARSRPSTRPRPNPITRNRPPRPGFLRPRPGSEPEETETTTVAAETSPSGEETSPSAEETSATDDSDDNETDEDSETSEEGTEEPATTEGNRFSALFRPRNRNAIGGNRPRPVIGNRPPRS